MVVNTQTIERYLFINLFIILIYITERSQMSILINFRILQHKIFDVNQEYFLRSYMTHWVVIYVLIRTVRTETWRYIYTPIIMVGMKVRLGLNELLVRLNWIL